MKLFATALSAAAVGLVAIGAANAQQTQPRCASVYTRKEIRTLTAAELNVVKSVMTTMQNNGWFAWFAYLHTQWFGQIHSQSQFFPFHRRFVHEWERVARTINPAYTQPYWDEIQDYRAPAQSPVFTANYAGGNGRGGNGCVQNGLQNGWTMTYPSNHCLQRSFSNNGNIGSWYSPEYIASVLQRSTTMAQFRPGIEFSLHGIVHVNIGGDMATRPSPNDWIFMLHHANIDRLWWQWQQAGNLWTMDGPNYDGTAITLNSNIAYFNQPIRTVMQLGYGQMCFQYASNPIQRRSLRGLSDILRDLDALDTAALAAVLPQDLLAKWFPKLDTKIPPSLGSPSKAAGRVIPMPNELPDSWIDQQVKDAAGARQVRADARNFAQALIKAGYKSRH
ncbi:hypothetical protein H4R18_003472 [Coemansia javaensis]|uniref:Tyrosinase copper-binding domain-containing protein n=1 Tax=Coemansia javaensis TaxID=2761396 RepID=A0A9W8H6W1_9FUNG|nr:hypothetical protein H4R18_003472 [Coemansia javaensis]